MTHSADTGFGRIEYLDLGTGAPVLVLHGSPGGCDQGAVQAQIVRFLRGERGTP